MRLLQKFRLSNKKRIVFVFLASLLLIIALGLYLSLQVETGSFGINAMAFPTSMPIFKSESAHFTMQYPSNWTAIETPQGDHGDLNVVAVILPPGRSFPQMVVASRPISDGDIGEVVSWGTMRASKKPKYNSGIVTSLNTTHFRGFTHDYTWLNQTFFGTETIYCQDFYVLDGDVGYVLSSCAQSRDWPNFRKLFYDMIQSFSTDRN